MKKGGFQLVDFQNVAFTSGSAATVKGIYSQIQNGNGKVLVATNLNVGGINYTNSFFSTVLNPTEDVKAILVLGSNKYTLDVTTKDSVTITTLE